MRPIRIFIIKVFEEGGLKHCRIVTPDQVADFEDSKVENNDHDSIGSSCSKVGLKGIFPIVCKAHSLAKLVKAFVKLPESIAD